MISKMLFNCKTELSELIIVSYISFIIAPMGVVSNY